MSENSKPGQKGLTLRELWKYLGIDITPKEPMPDWPPDLFALCAAALKKSGAYTMVLNPQRSHEESAKLRAKRVRDAGQIWCIRLSDLHRQLSPKEQEEEDQRWEQNVSKNWKLVVGDPGINAPGYLDLEIFRITDHDDLCSSLIDLMAVADEACRGVGLPLTRYSEGDEKKVPKPPLAPAEQPVSPTFHTQADTTLFPRQLGSTLCKRIRPSVARVLPKMHTAQAGLTIRSFSHHLAFCESEEVRPTWVCVPSALGDTEDINRMNILIAPWPEVVHPTRINELRGPRSAERPYNSFEVDILSTGGSVADRLAALAEEAERRVGPIDMVILPELAVTTRDYRLARSALLRKGILSIMGVGSKSRSANYLTIDVPISHHHALHLRQRKHHRWKLDESQIRQYHIGSRLNPERVYWEHIDVRERQLRFVVLRPWLVATALICEDLARHDPVGDLIKGIGPNLVIALLMDGPQLRQRWPGRYAAALADDPGCSVLSITSLGMAKLSRAASGESKATAVVGLWKDALSGNATEIELKDDHQGVVLTLVMRRKAEKTADFRNDGGLASYPSLAGYHQIRIPDNYPRLEAPLNQPNWLSVAEASLLARLVQRPTTGKHALTEKFMPEELTNVHGSAFRIGREIWRLKTSGKVPEIDPFGTKKEIWASVEELDTAAQIVKWNATNLRHS